jgi:hypothetical protein
MVNRIKVIQQYLNIEGVLEFRPRVFFRRKLSIVVCTLDRPHCNILFLWSIGAHEICCLQILFQRRLTSEFKGHKTTGQEQSVRLPTNSTR